MFDVAFISLRNKKGLCLFKWFLNTNYINKFDYLNVDISLENSNTRAHTCISPYIKIKYLLRLRNNKQIFSGLEEMKFD